MTFLTVKNVLITFRTGLRRDSEERARVGVCARVITRSVLNVLVFVCLSEVKLISFYATQPEVPAQTGKQQEEYNT